MAVAYASINDFVRKDGLLVRVLNVDHSEETYRTSDGGYMNFEEVGVDDVVTESEAYIELHGHLPDAADVV